MKFIVDAQLPKGIVQILRDEGIDAIHTDDLPNKERTTDNEIMVISKTENRIIITKDTDFIDVHYIKNLPKKLLLITTGNIKNKALYTSFKKNLEKLIHLFGECDVVEMDNTTIIGH